jgi:uncharacterized FAD-dependent dehydrogenase
MPNEILLRLLPAQAADSTEIEIALRNALSHGAEAPLYWAILRRSIDARKNPVWVQLKIAVYQNPPEMPSALLPRQIKTVNPDKRVIIAGSGPAGLFAALKLIQRGIKPVILERGKDVSSRRKDLSLLHTKHIVNPDSNYCFGEGGAGTYSDGKLYTRSHKRGNLQSVLETLVQFGASADILIDAHPHIGTNKLPRIITAMRKYILECGGEVHFESRITDIETAFGAFSSVQTLEGRRFEGGALILATGHSARDIYKLFADNKWTLEAKSFAMGVRVEHPQTLIDTIQYHCAGPRDKFLPASSYALVKQAGGRGVYSFCMCPGGFIVPAATAPGEVVVNGMSTSTRDSRFANSGIVVSVEPSDLKPFEKHGALAGLMYQQQLESLACHQAGNTQAAPAQRLEDFVKNRHSATVNPCSYLPGVVSSSLHEWLPAPIRGRLQEGFAGFGKMMKGFLSNDGQILGVESRTSAPVRIPRSDESLQHPEVSGLYPCGEGAGYAGGIISAAMDGEKVALKIQI